MYTKNEELCIENEEICIKNDEFCSRFFSHVRCPMRCSWRSQTRNGQFSMEVRQETVSFQWKNPDFLLKNVDFIIKNSSPPELAHAAAQHKAFTQTLGE